MNDRYNWTWKTWVALIVGAGLWVALWYGIGSILWFIFSLR